MLIKTAFAQVFASLPEIAGAPEPTSPASLVAYIFLLALSITGIAVLVAFLIGAFRYFASVGNAGAIQDGKDRMAHALLGLAILVFSVILLYTINPDFLKLRDPALVRIDLPEITEALPEDCSFLTAQWAGNAIPGGDVGLVVATQVCENGGVVTFRIFEDGGGLRATLTSTILGNAASGEWTIPQNAAGIDFYFEATMDSKRIVSGFLATGSDPTAADPFPGECKNPEVGNPAPSSCEAPCESTVNSCALFIDKAATKFSVPAALIVAVMQEECPSGNPACIDASGGCGLMQVNPTLLFNPPEGFEAEFIACQQLLGEGASDIDQACSIMTENPNIAIEVGACILEIDARWAARFKSRYNYPANEIQYTAAAYNSDISANQPSCNCRNSGDSQLPEGCTTETSRVCQNCFTTVPRWLCGFDSPNPDTCTVNTEFSPTQAYAATIKNYYTHYRNCPRWKPSSCTTGPFSINKTLFSIEAPENAWILTISNGPANQPVSILVEWRDADGIFHTFETESYGSTNTEGNWSLENMFTLDEIGEWRETAKVGSETLNCIEFVVRQ